MKPLNSLLTLLFFLLTSFQTEKKKQELPPLTHSGENVFACRLNGKIIIASASKNDLSGASPVKFNPPNSNGMVYISAAFPSPRYDIELSFNYDDTPGVYPIVVQFPYYGYFWDYTQSISPTDDNQYMPDDTHTGSVKITYDDGKIMAGTFALEAVNSRGKVVHITEGRFDVRNPNPSR